MREIKRGKGEERSSPHAPRDVRRVPGCARPGGAEDVRWGRVPSYATWDHVARGHTRNHRGAAIVIGTKGGRMEGREKEREIRVNGNTWRIEIRL